MKNIIKKIFIISSPLSWFFCCIFFPGCQHLSVREKSLDKEYLIFVKEPFEMILPQTIPAALEVTNEINIFASLGEYEPATFAIHALKELKDITVEINDLKGERGKVIPKDCIDIRVVKVWRQAGTWPSKGEAVDVPELLLYDDTINLKGLAPAIGKNNRDRIIKTNIPKTTSKQFWITLKVPKNAPSGKYIAKLTIIPKTASVKEINLKVNVLPIKLLPPEKDYAIYFNSTLEPTGAWNSIDVNRYYKQLVNIKEHGFSSPSIRDSFSYLGEAMVLRMILGFKGPIPYIPDLPRESKNEQFIKKVEKFVQQNNYLPLVYHAIDEPNNEKKAQICKEMFTEIKKGGGKTIVAIEKKFADQMGDQIDLANYSVASDCTQEYIKAICQGTVKKNNKKEWYYWQMMLENPLVNRILYGFYLWKSQLDGIFGHTYQFPIGDPYDDFDNGSGSVHDCKFRDHMTTYPSKEGPLDTIQWEAAREGIDDVRYLTTLNNLIKRTSNQAELKKAREIIAEVMQKIKPNYWENIKDLSPQELKNFRWKIAKTIIDLDALLGNE